MACQRSIDIFQILICKILTPSSVPPTGSQMSAGRIAREFWWTSQEFTPAGITITMAPYAHISTGG
jgi:hypothetical protein